MNTRSCWAVAFLVLLLFAGGMVSAEPASDAIETGNACLDKQDFGAAIAAFTESIRINPQSAEAYRGRARACLRNGEPHRAIPDYSEALRINPKYVEAYWGRGAAYTDTGNFDKAFEDCAEALRLNPKSAEAYSNRGSIYLKKGDFNSAIADFSKAIRLNPKLPEPHRGRASAYGNKGSFDKAIADYTEAIRINPKVAGPFYGRGLAYSRRNDFDEAIRDFTEAIRLNPKLADAYRARGIAHSEKREATEAEADFAQAKTLADVKLSPIRGEMWDGWEPRRVAKSPAEIVEILHKLGLKAREVRPESRSVESLAGHYTHPSVLSGENCYLFSDASYIYTTWSDIHRETIYEKGTWSVQDGWVLWNPDRSLPHDILPKDHVYAPLLVDEGEDIHLMSHRWNFSYFLDHVDQSSPANMFRICSLRRKSRPSKAAQEEKRKQLMAEAWNPDFFKQDDSKESRH